MRLPDLRSASRPQPRRRPGANARLLALAGTGVVAGGAFGAVAVASARRDTVEPDNELHDAMRESLDGPVGRAAEAAAPAVEPAARWWVYGPAALAAAAAVLAAPDQSRRPKRRRRAGAAAIAVVPALVTAISPAFDRWLPQPPVGPRRRPVDHPVFPSGHAFRATAVALTGAYVVAREELARPGRVWAVAAAVPAVVGIARLVREKHLASDVVGGWLAGITLAALAAGAYEAAGGPRRRSAPGIFRRKHRR